MAVRITDQLTKHGLPHGTGSDLKSDLRVRRTFPFLVLVVVYCHVLPTSRKTRNGSPREIRPRDSPLW